MLSYVIPGLGLFLLLLITDFHIMKLNVGGIFPDLLVFFGLDLTPLYGLSV